MTSSCSAATRSAFRQFTVLSAGDATVEAAVKNLNNYGRSTGTSLVRVDLKNLNNYGRADGKAVVKAALKTSANEVLIDGTSTAELPTLNAQFLQSTSTGAATATPSLGRRRLFSSTIQLDNKASRAAATLTRAKPAAAVARGIAKVRASMGRIVGIILENQVDLESYVDGTAFAEADLTVADLGLAIAYLPAVATLTADAAVTQVGESHLTCTATLSRVCDDDSVAGTIGAGTIGSGTMRDATGAPTLGSNTIGAGTLGSPSLGTIGSGLIGSGTIGVADGLVPPRRDCGPPEGAVIRIAAADLPTTTSLVPQGLRIIYADTDLDVTTNVDVDGTTATALTTDLDVTADVDANGLHIHVGRAALTAKLHAHRVDRRLPLRRGGAHGQGVPARRGAAHRRRHQHPAGRGDPRRRAGCRGPG